MVGAMDSPTIRRLRGECRAPGSGGASGTDRHRLAGSEAAIARLDVLLASGITRLLIPGILAAFEDNVLERAFPCFPVDLLMRRSWVVRVAVATEIEPPA
jgi:hypothetical protein